MPHGMFDGFKPNFRPRPSILRHLKSCEPRSPSWLTGSTRSPTVSLSRFPTQTKPVARFRLDRVGFTGTQVRLVPIIPLSVSITTTPARSVDGGGNNITDGVISLVKPNGKKQPVVQELRLTRRWPITRTHVKTSMSIRHPSGLTPTLWAAMTSLTWLETFSSGHERRERPEATLSKAGAGTPAFFWPARQHVTSDPP